MENIDFEKVVHVMNLSCISKIRDCVASAQWTEEAVEKALKDSGIKVGALTGFFKGNELETIDFNARVPFEANEVQGIIVPFDYCVHAEVTLNPKLGRYEVEVFFGPKRMMAGENHDMPFDVDWLYHMFCQSNGHMNISDFVSSDFDYAYYCHLFNKENPHYARIVLPPNCDNCE